MKIENILCTSFDFPSYLASSLGKIEATTKSQHEKGVYLYIVWSELTIKDTALILHMCNMPF